MLIENLTAEQAIEESKKNGAIVTPSLKVLEEADHGKVYSGKTAEGKLWKIIKGDDDMFSVEAEH